MLKEERKYYSDVIHFIAGVDEAGRGPLCGPVFAAAVIFPPDYENKDIDDSKKLTEKKREALFETIKKDALSYGIASVSASRIDEINIYEATKEAMKKAISMLKAPFDLIITDAMPLKDLGVAVIPMIKGDAKCLNIAAASILAKVSRDRYMNELEKSYPSYSFSKHKGYGTKAHLEELKKNGPIEGEHRKSFGPVAKLSFEQLKLF